MTELNEVRFGKYWRSSVLVRAALPGVAWVAEVDLHAGVDREAGVLGH
ncbi:MAG: hypothetical protein H0W37_12765 [Pseudonocardiales bacterium]|nr:hypothetical protein [Pseudonocardiales bacterium]